MGSLVDKDGPSVTKLQHKEEPFRKYLIDKVIMRLVDSRIHLE